MLDRGQLAGGGVLAKGAACHALVALGAAPAIFSTYIAPIIRVRFEFCGLWKFWRLVCGLFHRCVVSAVVSWFVLPGVWFVPRTARTHSTV